MISTFFLAITYGLVNLVVGFLPTGSLPSVISTSFAYLMGIVNAYSFIVPIDTLLQAAAVILVFDGSLMLWYFINWIIRKIPGMQ